MAATDEEDDALLTGIKAYQKAQSGVDLLGSIFAPSVVAPTSVAATAGSGAWLPGAYGPGAAGSMTIPQMQAMEAAANAAGRGATQAVAGSGMNAAPMSALGSLAQAAGPIYALYSLIQMQRAKDAAEDAERKRLYDASLEDLLASGFDPREVYSVENILKENETTGELYKDGAPSAEDLSAQRIESAIASNVGRVTPTRPGYPGYTQDSGGFYRNTADPTDFGYYVLGGSGPPTPTTPPMVDIPKPGTASNGGGADSSSPVGGGDINASSGDGGERVIPYTPGEGIGGSTTDKVLSDATFGDTEQYGESAATPTNEQGWMEVINDWLARFPNATVEQKQTAADKAGVPQGIVDTVLGTGSVGNGNFGDIGKDGVVNNSVGDGGVGNDVVGGGTTDTTKTQTDAGTETQADLLSALPPQYTTVTTSPGELADIQYLYDIGGDSIFAPQIEKPDLRSPYNSYASGGRVGEFDIVAEALRLLRGN